MRDRYLPANNDNILGMACHTFALSGDEAYAAVIHQRYEELTMALAPFAEKQYNNNVFASDLKKSTIKRLLQAVRQEYLEKLVKELYNEDNVIKQRDNLYICGGYSSNNLMPEHMWLEDRDAGMTFDRFINTLPGECIAQRSVGNEGEAFEPGCVDGAFLAHQIARVKVTGYTHAQVETIQRLPSPYSDLLN